MGRAGGWLSPKRIGRVRLVGIRFLQNPPRPATDNAIRLQAVLSLEVYRTRLGAWSVEAIRPKAEPPLDASHGLAPRA